MKKVVVFMLIFVVITFFIIEKKQETPSSLALLEENIKNDEKRAIFVSYIEYGNHLKGKTIENKKERITTMLETL